MGNSLGGKKSVKIMKITGETIKLKAPVKAEEMLKDYPGHVLLESESVKHYGSRAKPLEPLQELRPKRLYFLVVLPPKEEKGARRVRSGINMSAKERLESLMLARRSASDLNIMMKPPSIMEDEVTHVEHGGGGGGRMLKMRMSKAELERMMRESKDEEEAAEKIVRLCMARNAAAEGSAGVSSGSFEGGEGLQYQQHQGHHLHGSVRGGVKAPRQRRVGFLPINEGEIQQVAVAY